MEGVRLGPYFFEPITEAHFPLIHTWLNTPHVAVRWDSHTSMMDVVARFGEKITSDWQRVFIVSRDGQPFGYAQSYKAYRAGDGWWPGEPNTTVGIDQFIGEVSLIGKGLGTEMVRQFSDWLLTEPGTGKVITDPEPDNERAIKCYRRAGFRDVGIVDTPDGKALLMEKYSDNQSVETDR